jgi:hypothetical protein
MKTETLSFDPARGWSVPVFPPLDSDRTLLVAFGAAGYMDDPGPLKALIAAYPRARTIGCSTAGEIFGNSITDGTLSVAICKFDQTELRSASAPVLETSGSEAAGRALATQLMAPDLRGVIVISDGLNVNGTELLRGLNAILPPSVVVTGGLAGDGSRFARTWVLHEGAPVSGRVCAVGLYGERVTIGHGSKGGWDIFGPERVITRSAGNVLYEIDDRPALGLYKEYLGDLASGLPATALLFPLSMRRSRTEETRLVRTILGISEQDRSMTFAGDVPEGSLVQLMRANFDRLIDGAIEAARLTRSAEPDPESLTIAVSCVGRRLVLGERAEEEVEAVLDTLPPKAHLVGFYSYGEISPYATGRCELHNQTMTLTQLSER